MPLLYVLQADIDFLPNFASREGSSAKMFNVDQPECLFYLQISAVFPSTFEILQKSVECALKSAADFQ